MAGNYRQRDPNLPPHMDQDPIQWVPSPQRQLLPEDIAQVLTPEQIIDKQMESRQITEEMRRQFPGHGDPRPLLTDPLWLPRLIGSATENIGNWWAKAIGETPRGKPSDFAKSTLAGIPGIVGDVGEMATMVDEMSGGRVPGMGLLKPLDMYPTTRDLAVAMGGDPDSMAGFAGEMFSPLPNELVGGVKAITMFGASTPEFRSLLKKAASIFKPGGKPVVLYHGSMGNIEKYDLERAAVSNDWGRAVYMSSNPAEVSANYAGLGPDMELRTQLRAERIIDSIWDDPMTLDDVADSLGKEADDLTDDDVADYARKMALKEMDAVHQGAIYPLYSFLEKPAIAGSPNETTFTLSVDYKGPDGDEVMESGTAIDLFDAIREAEKEFFDVDADALIADLYDHAIDYGEIGLFDIKQAFAVNQASIYATDEFGEPAAMEFLARTLQNLGYDGVVDFTAGTRFRNMADVVPATQPDIVPEESIHVMAYDPDKLNTAFAGRVDDELPEPTFAETVLRHDELAAGRAAVASDRRTKPTTSGK